MKKKKAFQLIVGAVLQRNEHIHLLGVHNHRALDSFVEFGLHQTAQYISPGPNREIQVQRNRRNRFPTYAAQIGTSPVQWNVASYQHHRHRFLAIS